MNHRRSTRLSAAAAAALLLATGCQGDAETAPTTMAPTSTAPGSTVTTPAAQATTTDGVDGTGTGDGTAPSGSAAAAQSSGGATGGGIASGEPTTSATPTSDTGIPTSAQDYADSFVRAWGAEDNDRVARLSTENVPIMLRSRASDQWARTGSEAATGKVYVAYRENETGETITLVVDNALASQGAEHAVVDVRLTTPG